MQTLASNDLVFYLGFVVREKLNTLILLGLYIIVFDLVTVFENALSIGNWSKYSTYINPSNPLNTVSSVPFPLNR